MQFREVTIFSGQTFHVPQSIQRIDTRATHGWQVRYHGTKMFSDHSSDGSGAGPALKLAVAELLRRIKEFDAPVRLQKGPASHKSNALPPGISGPIYRQREGSKVRSASYCVLLPRFGKSAKCSTVYIANDNTWTPERESQALAKAVEWRQKAESAYEADATQAMRLAAQILETHEI